MFSTLTQDRPWQLTLRQGVVFVAVILVLLTLARVVFLTYFGSPALSDALLALWTGFRVDLKWSAILLLPAWLICLLTYPWPRLKRALILLVGLTSLLLMSLEVINLGFFAFYRTPISSIIFGLWQDDTKAILATLWSDWPVVQLVLAALVLTLLPLLATRLVRPRPYGERRYSKTRFAITAIVITALFGLAMRGSLGKFPLRLQDWAVTTDAFVNASVPNGVAALYEAWKNQQRLSLAKGPEEGVHQLGFASINDAKNALNTLLPTQDTVTPLKTQPQFVVFALMESMGRDEFEADRPGVNDTLGDLRAVLPLAHVFRQGIAVEGGTFPSLEGILFDTPITPISQSRYGRVGFPFSRLWAYKKVGYETVFLTSGSVSWRQIDSHFPKHGFDEILGDQDILKVFPQAEHGTWGVGDEWMFRYANRLLEEKAQAGKRIFLFMLSSTNHPPHHVPDGANVNPVDPKVLPAFIEEDRTSDLVKNRLQTYQYSAGALGRFVERLEADHLLQSAVVVATGDHNSRQHYSANGVWHHANGVPVLFWLPEKRNANTQQWVSTRDIFPTLNALILGQAPSRDEGRDLFGAISAKPAQSFSSLDTFGLSLASSGAISLGVNGTLHCYRWENDRMIPESPCSAENEKAGQIARAQRAVRDYHIRHTLLNLTEKAR